ncbi:Spt20 family-domain-containing protein [Lipomyces oligophaga]|uniref:Spt20 family-domain-containing protein n=1 Tax=Lipomyces oligophaga TaxID=45792 RepID=UPI0034CFA327
MASKTRPPNFNPGQRQMYSTSKAAGSRQLHSATAVGTTTVQGTGTAVAASTSSSAKSSHRNSTHVNQYGSPGPVTGTASTATSAALNSTPANSTRKMSLNSMRNAHTSTTVPVKVKEEDALFTASGRRQRLTEHKFAESTEEILDKYKDSPPSMEFHIHPTHYRFGNQDAIIPKNSPLIKSFLDMMDLEQIPPAAVEIFRQSGIRYFEGCIIMQVYDHREQEVSELEPSGFSSDTKSVVKSSTDSKNELPLVTTAKEPKIYRVLLRPTSLSMWYDLTMFAELLGSSRVSDNFCLALESELLKLTVPKLNLSVSGESKAHVHNPGNQFKHHINDDGLQLEIPALLKQSVDPSIGKRDNFDRLHAPNPASMAKRRRPLHEDLHHQTSEYEEMMLIMDDSPESGSGQFLRLGFVEQWRRKREREQHQKNVQAVQAAQAAHASQAQSAQSALASGNQQRFDSHRR